MTVKKIINIVFSSIILISLSSCISNELESKKIKIHRDIKTLLNSHLPRIEKITRLSKYVKLGDSINHAEQVLGQPNDIDGYGMKCLDYTYSSGLCVSFDFSEQCFKIGYFPICNSQGQSVYEELTSKPWSFRQNNISQKNITDNTIRDMWNSQKSKYIEKAILIKLRKKQSEEKTIINRDKLCQESYELLNWTYLALGEKTLRFLDALQINNNLVCFNKERIPIIKKRLLLISLLKNYSSKNRQAKMIIERIRFFSPFSINYYWKEEKYKDVPPPIYLRIKNYKIGPLLKDKFIYVKSYEENNRVLFFEVSLGLEKHIIFIYNGDSSKVGLR